MKLPRDLGGQELAHQLEKFGYCITRQTGSHLRLSHADKPVHHLTIPRHKPLRVGTLNNIIKELADHLKINKEELLRKLLKE
jgi:predicted RNA binding protein YcfA (HicA-like mRNA interferase family)